MSDASRDLESQIQLLASLRGDPERMTALLGVRWHREEAPPFLRVIHGEADNEIWGTIELRLPADVRGPQFALCIAYPATSVPRLPLLHDFMAYLGERVAQVDVNIHIPPAGATSLVFLCEDAEVRVSFWSDSGALRLVSVRHRL